MLVGCLIMLFGLWVLLYESAKSVMSSLIRVIKQNVLKLR